MSSPPMAMALPGWSSLPSKVLRKISKILNTDVDTLRIRSVCSSWRSSLPPPLRPSFFPLKLPPIPLSCFAHYFLNFSTLYRLAQPQIGPRAGDTSDGWLFRALEVSPNRFSLLSPLVPVKADCAPGTVPNSLNLLEYRITEICKCYGIFMVEEDACVTDLLCTAMFRIDVLWNDSDFVVFVLFIDSSVRLWKYGDEEWTDIDFTGHHIVDLFVSSGTCYAISDRRVLFSFDKSLKLKLIPMASIPVSTLTHNRLLDYKSDLYVVLQSNVEITTAGRKDIFKIFKKCEYEWKHMSSLTDGFFLCCEDASIGLAAEDFRSSKGNCVYLAFSIFTGSSRIISYGVGDLADGGPAVLRRILDHFCMNWPPPSWLLSD